MIWVCGGNTTLTEPDHICKIRLESQGSKIWRNANHVIVTFHLHEYTRNSKKVMHPIFHFMLFTSWKCENFTEPHNDIADIVIFQGSLHLLWTVIFHLWTRACIPTQGKLFSILCSQWCIAICGASWHNGILIKMTKQVRGQDHRVYAANLLIQNLWWSLWHAHLCAA